MNTLFWTSMDNKRDEHRTSTVNKYCAASRPRFPEGKCQSFQLLTVALMRIIGSYLLDDGYLPTCLIVVGAPRIAVRANRSSHVKCLNIGQLLNVLLCTPNTVGIEKACLIMSVTRPMAHTTLAVVDVDRIGLARIQTLKLLASCLLACLQRLSHGLTCRGAGHESLCRFKCL